MRSVRFRGDGKNLRASEINRWNAIANQHARGELRSPTPPRLNAYDPNSRVALVKNTTGADRAAFDTMAIEGLLWDLEADGTADIIFELAAAAADKQPAILIEPIAAGEFGRAVVDGLAIAKVKGGTGSQATIDAAGHRLEPAESGAIVLLQTPHATEERLLPVVLHAGRPAETHFLFTLTEAISSGSGSATIRDITDSEEIETGATLYDPLGHFDGLTSGYRGFCFASGAAYYALGPYVTKVRWEDPVLEYSRDGASTWLNIDTAEDCT